MPHQLPKGQVDFTTYLGRILRGVHPDRRISDAALKELNSLVNTLGKQVLAKAEELTFEKGQSTIFGKTIRGAAMLLFGESLPKHGLRADKSEGGKKVNVTITAARAGHFFKSGTGAQKQVGKTGLRIGGPKEKTEKREKREGAAEALAAVLNDFAAGLLKAATPRKGKITLKARDLFLASQKVSGIQHYFQSQGITMAGVGAVPTGVNPALVSGKKKARKSKPATGGIRQPHRFRPGTVAVREIKKYQKSDDMLLQVAPFKRVAREFAGKHRISAKAFAALQSYVESEAVALLYAAGMVSINAKRQTVAPKDIKVAKITCGQYAGHSKEYRVSSAAAKLSNASIQRLARRGGVKRVATASYDVMKGCISYKVEQIMRGALVFTENSERKTVTSSHIAKGIESAFGQRLAAKM